MCAWLRWDGDPIRASMVPLVAKRNVTICRIWHQKKEHSFNGAARCQAECVDLPCARSLSKLLQWCRSLPSGMCPGDPSAWNAGRFGGRVHAEWTWRQKGILMCSSPVLRDIFTDEIYRVVDRNARKIKLANSRGYRARCGKDCCQAASLDHHETYQDRLSCDLFGIMIQS